MRSLRAKLGMTQMEFAIETEVSLRAVQNWENGTSEPDWRNAIKLLELGGMICNGGGTPSRAELQEIRRRLRRLREAIEALEDLAR